MSRFPGRIPVDLSLVFVTGLLAFLLAAVPVHSQPVYWGTVARGMGQAYTASGEGLGGISFNPANSASLSRGQFISDYTDISRRVSSLQNGALGSAVQWGPLVSGLVVHQTDLEHSYDEFATSSNLSLHFNDSVYYFNTALELTTNLQAGLNLKYFNVRSDVEGGDASGQGLDAGLLWKLSTQSRLGFSVINLYGRKSWTSGHSEELDLEVRTGYRYRFTPNLEGELDAVFTSASRFKTLSSGFEWWMWRRRTAPVASGSSARSLNGLAFRLGLNQHRINPDALNVSLGFSLAHNGIRVDYAYQRKEHLNNQYYLGLSTYFGGSQPPETKKLTTKTHSEPDTRLGVVLHEKESFPTFSKLRGLLTKVNVDAEVVRLTTEAPIVKHLLSSTFSSSERIRLLKENNLDQLLILDNTGSEFLVTGKLIEEANSRSFRQKHTLMDTSERLSRLQSHLQKLNR